uniref:Uncharacterized protein n=1 Tax=Aegilops tauschii subsp. strangulata TaxID=200361 RepID=A0A453PCB8_AEGTS
MDFLAPFFCVVIGTGGFLYIRPELLLLESPWNVRVQGWMGSEDNWCHGFTKHR